MNLSFKMFFPPPSWVYVSLNWKSWLGGEKKEKKWTIGDGGGRGKEGFDVVEQENSYGSRCLLWPIPKTFTIWNRQFFSLHHMGNTVWVCSSDWLYYVCGEEYLTWHSESCQVASAALRACAWLTPGDGGWPAFMLRWDCILPFQGAYCMGFALYPASEAPHLRFKNYSRELSLFHWELWTPSTSGELVLFM